MGEEVHQWCHFQHPGPSNLLQLRVPAELHPEANQRVHADRKRANAGPDGQPPPSATGRLQRQLGLGLQPYTHNTNYLKFCLKRKFYRNRTFF